MQIREQGISTSGQDMLLIYALSKESFLLQIHGDLAKLPIKYDFCPNIRIGQKKNARWQTLSCPCTIRV